jgi:hypothetical protein
VMERGGHQTLSASVWGLDTLARTMPLLNKGLSLSKAYPGNQLCHGDCLVFSRRSEALVQSVKSGRVAKTMLGEDQV